ncbi:MAG: G5 domain-containing protein [Peptostreptococcaceae bacterium]|nr:G5 domain-containing protein [Peptostreptococcaceae bacterium]
MSKRNIMLSAFVLIMAAALFFLPNWEKTIIVSDGGSEKKLETRLETVAEALDEYGYELKPTDEIFPEGNEKLKNGMTIEIKRSFAVVLKDESGMKAVYTLGPLVEDVLVEEGLALRGNDRVEPALDEPVESGDAISVTRVSEQTVFRQELYPYSIETRKNPDWGTDDKEILQEGVDGIKLLTYVVTYENGVATREEKVSEEIVTEPVAEIIEKGDGRLLVASRGDLRFEKSMTMTSTAYDLSVASCGKTPDHPEYGITYSGTRAKRGTVAVDPREIPLGTRLYIESLDGTRNYGFAVAEDTGSAVKGNIIDLFMESESDVAAYGKRKVKVYILE